MPDFLDDTTHVASARVVAVRSTPAEAHEGDAVTLDGLVAAPDGAPAAVVGWSLCLDRKPLSELGPVSTRCLQSPSPGSDIAEALDPTPPVTAKLPSDACELFGPERPEPKPGEPSGRPVDPDVTGGFYQPVLAWIGATPVLGGVRLECPLTGASPDATRDFNARYNPNTNPAPVALEAVHADGTSEVLSDGAPHAFTAGESVELRATLPACDPAAAACGGAENYVVYDALDQTIVTQTESIVVSWYATDGDFSEPRSQALAEDDGSLAAGVTWTLPGRSVTATVWAVARDDRGGAGWLAGAADIPP
ncbi:MAG TPA: hypothetical protein VMI54_16875 [Polyangiaceae bacterium]|nr:hypothetical protein [Polyangiaceae bacterium]